MQILHTSHSYKCISTYIFRVSVEMHRVNISTYVFFDSVGSYTGLYCTTVGLSESQTNLR